MIRSAALAAFVLTSVTAPVFAQVPAPTAQPQPFSVQLVPRDFPRVELSGSLGWQGVRKPGFDTWNRRYDTGAAAVSAGYFWTPHIRSDVTVTRFGDGTMFESVPNPIVSGRPQSFRYLEHRFHATSIAPALTYQFLENRWVHPSISIGADVIREREEIVEIERNTRATEVRWLLDPFIATGARFFVTEHAFVRTDVRYAFGGSANDRTSWTAGVGFEF